MSNKKSSVFLEVDKSIIENNLRLEGSEDDGLGDIFSALKTSQESGDTPWKLVKPTPGMCVKARTTEGSKVFINICHTPEIPAPEDITESRLMEIWTSEDCTSFRVPMSIGQGHEESDKAGSPSMAYDIAINPEFFKKVENSDIFRDFFLTLVLEGLQEKYTLQLQTEDYVILKNRKAVGELLPHRVRKGEAKKPARPLIEEITPAIPTSGRQPKYRIRSEPPEADHPEYLQAEFILEDLTSSHGLQLDVGEDRIVLDTPGKVGQQAYKLDIFIPYSVNQDQCSATFNADTRILTLKMPVVTAS